MTTVYLAGKITGDPCYFSKFLKAQRALENEGYIVVSPVILPGEGFSWDQYMRMTAAMLEECETVCFLPDWKESRGAAYEYGQAVARGKEIFFFADWLEAQKEETTEVVYYANDQEVGRYTEITKKGAVMK